ncbi:MAG: triose-phosphate isomerase [Woeseiaceae bacterium]|nr:triose-phosphate isomerase [Woeseiaceae bacterium]
MRRILVAGNWKLNGSLAANAELLDGIIAGASADAPVDLLVCPPYPYLAGIADKLEGTGIAVGAQNVSQQASGAFTGEVAASMLVESGCTHVLVGHSERRSLYGESSKTVAEKFEAAQAAKLIPVLCIGETLEEREAGRTEAVVSEQLDAVIEQVGVQALADSILAYEPVWAIGTGMTATPEQAQDVHKFIRERIAGLDASVAEGLRILYGGSVKGSNAAGLFAMADIDGGLIGGASLKADDFLAIANAAS